MASIVAVLILVKELVRFPEALEPVTVRQDSLWFKDLLSVFCQISNDRVVRVISDSADCILSAFKIDYSCFVSQSSRMKAVPDLTIKVPSDFGIVELSEGLLFSLSLDAFCASSHVHCSHHLSKCFICGSLFVDSSFFNRVC